MHSHSFINPFIYQVQFINKFIKFLLYVKAYCSEDWEHSSEHNEISVLVGLMFQAHIPYIGGDRSAKQMQI